MNMGSTLQHQLLRLTAVDCVEILLLCALTGHMFLLLVALPMAK